MEISGVVIGLVLALVFVGASAYVIFRSYDRGRGRVTTNEERPGQPEPGESKPANAPDTRG